MPLVNNVDAETAGLIDLDPYTSDDFLKDLERVTAGKYDRELGRVLVEESRETVGWMRGLGVRFQLSFNRQAYKVGGRYKFWGGMCLKTQAGGKGLVADLREAARRHGVEVLFETAAKKLNLDATTGNFQSLEATGKDGSPILIHAKAVVLAGK